MSGLDWHRDELPGFERAVLELPSEGDGPLVATLIRSARDPSSHRPRRAVLHVHGYVDYFFQAHVAQAFQAADFDFYALDLRRYGRSLRPGNLPCQCERIDDYFAELTWALDVIEAEAQSLSALLGHSTGGLISSLYLHRGARASRVASLVLNSPFFDFRVSPLERYALCALTTIGERKPQWVTPIRLNPAYGQSLHRDHHGEWSYDLKKKPLRGFSVTAGWLRAIERAQRELQAGLDLRCPVLLQHSKKSRISGKSWTALDQEADTVLDVEHMKLYGPRLGSRVELQEFDGGLHDLTLSKESVRERVLTRMIEFVSQHASTEER